MVGTTSAYPLYNFRYTMYTLNFDWQKSGLESFFVMLALQLNQRLRDEQKYFQVAYNWMGSEVVLGLFARFFR